MNRIFIYIYIGTFGFQFVSLRFRHKFYLIIGPFFEPANDFLFDFEPHGPIIKVPIYI